MVSTVKHTKGFKTEFLLLNSILLWGLWKLFSYLFVSTRLCVMLNCTLYIIIVDISIDIEKKITYLGHSWWSSHWVSTFQWGLQVWYLVRELGSHMHQSQKKALKNRRNTVTNSVKIFKNNKWKSIFLDWYCLYHSLISENLYTQCRIYNTTHNVKMYI